MPSSWIGCGAGRRALSLTRISRAITIQLATRDEPPWDRNGVVMPVSGISWVTPPTMMKTWSAKTNARPAASSLANGSRVGDRRAQAALHQQAEDQQQRHQAGQPEFLAESGDDEVALHQRGAKGWPWPRPVPKMPPNAIPSRPWASCSDDE